VKDVLRSALFLMLFCLLAALFLVQINHLTRHDVTARHGPEFVDTVAFVIPGSETGAIVPAEENGKPLYYIGYKSNNRRKVAGYAFLTESKGYCSTIRTLVGIDPEGRIVSMKILSEQETPNLGMKCEEIRPGETSPWWQSQFFDKQADKIRVDKDGGPIQVLTGATITSRAITDSIASKARFVLSCIRSEKP
jgi:electron transport complex protein RnfG